MAASTPGSEPPPAEATRAHRAVAIAAPLALAAMLLAAPEPVAAAMPDIRIHEGNRVPACVSTRRLMLFLEERNKSLDPRFKDLAKLYKQHGEALGVRWDYAFFQMLLETGNLSFRSSPGRKGDVSPQQYNFAGIGTTGGGVPGDRFPDASTGVRAHIQHLVAYSGQRVEDPVAKRTREMQEAIVRRSLALRRQVNFADLARRWAVDGRYGRFIQMIADRFNEKHCHGPDPEEPAVASGKGRPTAAVARSGEIDAGKGGTMAKGAIDQSDGKRSGLGLPAKADGTALAGTSKGAEGAGSACRVWTASYGGRKNVLISRTVQGERHLTALTVLDGLEKRLAEAFISEHAKGGQLVGQFATRSDALEHAFGLCPSAAGPSAPE